MTRDKARSVEAVTARLETMSAPAVAAIAANLELLGILGDALVPTPARPRVGRAFGTARQAPLNIDEATARLDSLTLPASAVDTLSSEEVAALLGLGSRQAVHARLRRGSLLGVTGGKRGTRFPREQFVGDGQVVDGLVELQRLLGVGAATWAWLDEPSGRLGSRRPVELLREGKITEVLAAALSDSQGDFI